MDYQNARLVCNTGVGEYIYSDVRDADELTTICAYGPEYAFPVPGTEDFDNANVLPRPEAITDPNNPGAGPLYPNLCPIRRTLTPGEYATRRFTAIDGAGRTRLYGSKAFDATLQLEYLLTDDDLALLLESYHNARGSFRALSLGVEVFQGISPTLLAQIPDYLSWRWAETPVVESLLPGRSRVRVNLVATLDD